MAPARLATRLAPARRTAYVQETYAFGRVGPIRSLWHPRADLPCGRIFEPYALRFRGPAMISIQDHPGWSLQGLAGQLLPLPQRARHRAAQFSSARLISASTGEASLADKRHQIKSRWRCILGPAKVAYAAYSTVNRAITRGRCCAKSACCGGIRGGVSSHRIYR